GPHEDHAYGPGRVHGPYMPEWWGITRSLMRSISLPETRPRATRLVFSHEGRDEFWDESGLCYRAIRAICSIRYSAPMRSEWSRTVINGAQPEVNGSLMTLLWF